MEFFPNSKIFLQIGDFSIAWYAVLILSGALLAYLVAADNLKKLHYPRDFAEDLFTNVLIVGVIGSRLWFCAFYDLPYYLTHPWDILAIWQGGLAIHGGFLAAFLYSFYYCKKQGVSFYRAADAIVPNVLIAQAIGRWGNFANREAHGGIVSEAFFDGPLAFLKEGMFIDGNYYLPTFFFESVLCLLGFLLIHFLLRRYQNKRGDLMWAYFMWYGLIRFFIEAERTDALMIGPFRMAQLTSLAYLAVGLLGFCGIIDRFIKKRKPTILFDLDGTLIDSEKSIQKTFQEIFEKHGKASEFTNEVAVEVLGPSLKTMFTKYFPNEDTAALINEFRALHALHYEESAKLMPGAQAVLAALKEEGYHLGIVSTKLHQNVLRDLEHFGLAQYFEAIVGDDDVKATKPASDGINKILKDQHWLRDELIYLGDSVMDIKMAQNVGAYSIGYYFNPAKKDELTAAGANEYISDLNELLTIVKKPIHFTADLK